MTTEIIKCGCGAEFQWMAEPSDYKWIASILRPTSCPDCEKRLEKERLEAQRIESEKRLAAAITAIHSQIALEIPRLFSGTNITHERFNAADWTMVKDWQPSNEKPWLGFIGETGTCKTRIACLLAAYEMERQIKQRDTKSAQPFTNIPRFHFAPSYKISEIAALLQTGTFEQKEEARSYLYNIRSANLLVIDDLGKGRMNTAAIAAEIYALVDHRYSNALPTIWTANSTPEQIAANLTEDMAGPFAGRLNDSSRILRFK